MNWVDVTTGCYPDNGKIVLVYNSQGVHMAEYTQRTMGGFGFLAHVFSSNNELIHGVTHWMKLPEVPK